MDKNYQNMIIEAVKNGSLDSTLKTITDEISDFNYKISLKVKNTSNNPDPSYTKLGDSGFDFRANLDKDVILEPLDRILIPTGLFFDIPVGYEIQSRSRSGLAVKNGIMVLNSPGTIDENYTGEVCIILINLGKEPFTIKNNDRIAQGVLVSVASLNIVDIVTVNEINKITDRGINGFGSSGVK